MDVTDKIADMMKETKTYNQRGDHDSTLDYNSEKFRRHLLLEPSDLLGVNAMLGIREECIWLT